MEIRLFIFWGIGVMISWGVNALGRAYISIEIPFILINISWRLQDDK